MGAGGQCVGAGGQCLCKNCVVIHSLAVCGST